MVSAIALINHSVNHPMHFGSLKKRLVIVLFSHLIVTFCYAENTVTTIGPQRVNDVSHTYFLSLLESALKITNVGQEPTQLKVVPFPGQGRTIALMHNSSLIDVIWTAESPDRNEKILRIPVPLLKGGLGVRGLAIRVSDKAMFSAIEPHDLRAKLACQGMHWPDSDILENSGFKVHRVLHFDAMLEMLTLNRCDFLPLSIFEGQAELEVVKTVFPELTFYQDLLIKYPLAMYFYVNKNKPQLQQRLSLGLQKLQDNGELLRLMQTHPLTKNAFPLSQYDNARIITINNPQGSYSDVEASYLLPFFETSFQ